MLGRLIRPTAAALPLGCSRTSGARLQAGRKYATINHDESYVIQDWKRCVDYDTHLVSGLTRPLSAFALTPSQILPHSAPRQLTCRLRARESDSGAAYAAKARQQGMVPGVINRGQDAPYYIEMDSKQIISYMERKDSRFMGRRYKITVEDTGDEYEVVPHQLDVTPVGMRPQTVTFSLWNPNKIRPSRLARRAQRIIFEGIGARFTPLGKRRSTSERRRELAEAEK